MSEEWHRPTGDGTGWDEADPITESMRAQGMAELNGPVGDPAREAAEKPTGPPPPNERRFGERPRERGRHPRFFGDELHAIADAIDRDVTEAAGVQAARHLQRLGDAEEKARYYERLYLEQLEELRVLRVGTREQLGAADAALATAEREQAGLRRKVEELVEELRFAVGPGWRPERIEMHVEVGPFLERLAGIFGGSK